MLKTIIKLLLLTISFKAFATGIMAPAGLGVVLLFILAISLIGVIITFLIIRAIYKNSKNKAKTKKNIIRFFVVQTVIGLFVSTVWIPGYVSFTYYSIEENQPLEHALRIDLQRGFYYFELSDGRSYEFINKYRNSRRANITLEAGKLVMLSNADNNQYTLNSIGNTNEYYRYLRAAKKIVLTIPLSFKKIVKNQTQYEGTIDRITNNWIAAERHLTLAINDDFCCDLSWIERLLKNKANRKEIINRATLLHSVYYLNKKQYYQYRTEILVMLLKQSSVNVNQLNSIKQTILDAAVHRIDRDSYRKLNQSDREFIQFLIDVGVDQNLADNKHDTPLMHAIKDNNFQLAHLLLDNGAHFARRYENFESAREIVRRMIIESKANAYSYQDKQAQLISLLAAMNNKNKKK